jgi:hypothetical protein
VPELVPVDGWHRQPPEHVTVAGFKLKMSASGSALPSVQAADPVDVLYFPATHAAHGPPFGPVDPALQVQLVKAALPAGELELVGQVVHDDSVVCPVAILENE